MPDTGVGKLKRSYLLHYINTVFGTNGENPEWFLIGRDIEDLSVELNPEVESVKNILDEIVTDDKGYEPSISADTYYANTNDTIYPQLKNIAMNRLTGDDCKTQVLEVLIDTTGTSHTAWVEDCIVKPQSYGGAQGGVNIPYNISFNGNRKEGTVTITNKVPTFVETTASASE